LTDLDAAQSARESNLAMLRGQLNPGNAAKLGTGIVSPGNAQPLALLKQTDPDSFGTIVDGYKSKLIANPESIKGELRRFNTDPGSIGQVLTPEEQTAFLKYGQTVSSINKSSIARVGNSDLSDPVRMMMGDSKLAPHDLNAVVQKSAADEGVSAPDSSAAQQARAEIYNNILNQNTVKGGATVGGSDVLNVSGAQNAVRQIKAETGPGGRYSQIFGPDHVAQLDAFETYMSMIGGSKPAGSLSLSARVRNLMSPLAMIKEPKDWAMDIARGFNDQSLAAMFSQPASGNLFMKGITSPSEQNGLGMITGAAALAVKGSSDRKTQNPY
jgi:hypothetical protein